MADATARLKSPWWWVPSLYFAQGIPYVVIAMTVSVVMYKRMGISNDDIAYYTSWLYLPWVLKPLWSPVVDLVGTKRRWIVVMQAAIAVMMVCVALALPLGGFFRYTIALFWIMAFASATHDIAADGFYMLGLEQHQQAAFVGVRSTFYRIAMISGEGLLVMLAGILETRMGGNIPRAWSLTFSVLATVFFLAFLYHLAVLPRPASDGPRAGARSAGFVAEFFRVFGAFFRKDRILFILGFLLLYRFAEAQLLKMIGPFLIDPPSEGGLGLTTAQVGFVKGTVGVIGLLCGGIIGGIVISRRGLKYWLWPMVVSINFPGWVYLFLSYTKPQSLYLIAALVGVEQFTYGFGFTAYMLYMIYVAEGEHKTSHYALCTGFMALGMMLPGMFSGRLQEWLGYHNFFVWVLVSTLPCYLMACFVRVPPDFGCKKPAAA